MKNPAQRENRNQSTRRTIQLSDRDMKILRHVARFRMTTQDALHAQFFVGRKRDAVKSTLRRLCGPGGRGYYLKSEPLDAQRVYYRLTTRATQILGNTEDLARPLGIQARIRRYAILWLMCIDDSAVRIPFNLREFPEHFRVHGDRLPRSHFYVEEQARKKARLGFSIIDTGRHRRRVFRNASTSMRRFLEKGWLDEFISARCFDLSILTLTEASREAIELGAAKHLRRTMAEQLVRFGVGRDTPLPFSIHVRVVPGLLSVIPDGVTQRG
jgi:hypothetical protein